MGLGALPNSLRKGVWETKSGAGGLDGVPTSEVPKLEPRCCHDCPPTWVRGVVLLPVLTGERINNYGKVQMILLLPVEEKL